MLILFTDFGHAGPYVGQMKAVLHQVAPGVPVVDLLHDAPAFDPRRAAYLLAAYAPEFPEGSVFVCVVDPGVGSTRRPVIAKVAGHWYVGPDNGLLHAVIRHAGVETARAWEITWRPKRLSDSFHGRDLFAPVAGLLAAGGTPEADGILGTPIEAASVMREDWPSDLAEIVCVDPYGNLISGIRAAGGLEQRRDFEGGLLPLAGLGDRRGHSAGKSCNSNGNAGDQWVHQAQRAGHRRQPARRAAKRAFQDGGPARGIAERLRQSGVLVGGPAGGGRAGFQLTPGALAGLTDALDGAPGLLRLRRRIDDLDASLRCGHVAIRFPIRRYSASSLRSMLVVRFAAFFRNTRSMLRRLRIRTCLTST